MKKETIIDFYKFYSEKYEPYHSGIEDEDIEAEVTLLDDQVGGIVFLLKESKEINNDDVVRIKDFLNENIKKIKNLSEKDYALASFHFNSLLCTILQVEEYIKL